MAGTKAPRRKAAPPKPKSNGKPPAPAAPVVSEQIDRHVTAPLAVLAMHTHGEQESSRYALASVRIEHEDGRPLAISTDGRRMAVLTWNPDEGVRSNFFCPLYPLRAASDALKEIRCDNAVLSSRGVELKNAHGKGIEFRDSEIEGKFPLWREVIPDLEGYVTEFVDWRFLKEAAVVLGKMLGVDQRFISISLNPDKPVILSGHNRETGVRGCVVIMPMHYEGDERKPYYVPKGEPKAK